MSKFADQIKSLREERASIYSKAESTLESAATEKRALTGEEKQENEKRFDAMADLDSRIDQLQKLGEMAERKAESEAREATKQDEQIRRIGSQSAKEIPASEARSDVTDEEVRDATNKLLKRGVKALEDVRPEVRAMLTSVGSGVLVPDSSRRLYDEVMNHVDGVRALGATIVSTPGNGATIPLPVFADDEEAETVAEAADFSGSQGDITITPKQLGSQKYTSGIIKVSYELMRDDAFNLLGHIEKRLFERVAKKRHRDETTKVVAGAGSTITAAAANALSLDEWLNFEHKLGVQYRDGSTGVSMGDGLLRILRGMVGSDGHAIYDKATDGIRTKYGMYNYRLNPYLTTANDTGAVVGDWSHMFVRDIDLRFRRLDETYALTDETGFAVLASGDSVVGDTSAFVKLNFPAA